MHEKLEVRMDGVLLVEDDDHVEKLLGCQMQSNMKWGTSVQA